MVTGNTSTMEAVVPSTRGSTKPSPVRPPDETKRSQPLDLGVVGMSTMRRQINELRIVPRALEHNRRKGATYT
jgi:hypothetical protein